jgi:hypothetical protein
MTSEYEKQVLGSRPAPTRNTTRPPARNTALSHRASLFVGCLFVGVIAAAVGSQAETFDLASMQIVFGLFGGITAVIEAVFNRKPSALILVALAVWACFHPWASVGLIVLGGVDFVQKPAPYSVSLACFAICRLWALM